MMFRQTSAITLGTALFGVVLAAALFAGCAGAPRRSGADGVRTVSTEGWAPADTADPEAARRRALADAQRRAVEEVSGVSVAAVSRVEDAVTLRQKMTAEVRGFIERYEVLSETVADGFCKVSIRAWVRLGPSPAPTGPPPAEARVFLAMAGRGAAGVRRQLLARGFEVVEAPSAEALSLRGEAFAVPVRDARLAGLHSSRARVSLRAVAPGDGTVVWETVQEASAVDLDPALAEAAAVEKAGELAGQKAAGEVAQLLWKRF